MVVFKNKKAINSGILLLLTILALWSGKGLFKYSVYQTHDLDHHLVRGLDAVRTLSEGQFPLRWAGILNFECGVPVYNFYNPLLYYLLAVITFVSGNVMTSLKIVNLLSLLVGTIFFYAWMKDETKDIVASMGGALLYLFAPYRFLLIYVRGSPEYLAYAILPVIFYFYSKAIKPKKIVAFYLLLASLSGALLSISHNIVFLFSIPIIFIYLLVKIPDIKQPIKKKMPLILFSFFSIFALGAFFLVPAVLEKKFTIIDTPIFNYNDHYPTLNQLLFSKWGWGDSTPGIKLDGMSFQMGYSQWIVLTMSVLLLAISFLKNIKISNLKSKIDKYKWVITFLLITLLFLFLDLPISLPIWTRFQFLQTFQFPWRLLGVLVFTTSVLFSFILILIKNRYLKILLFVIISFLAIFGNRNHLLPQPVAEDKLVFYENLGKMQYDRYSVSAIQTNIFTPGKIAQCDTQTPIIITDSGELIPNSEIIRGSTFGKIKININEKIPSNSKLIFNLEYYPGIYIVKINSNKVFYNNCDGRLCIPIDLFNRSENLLEWNIVQSPLQKYSNLLSVLFLLFWLLIINSELIKTYISKAKINKI